MKYNLVFLLFVFQFALGKEKVEQIKYGKFSEEEINMKYCSIDSSAGAVVLSDIGSVNISFVGGLSVIYSKKFRIKVLDKKSLNIANYIINGVSYNSVQKLKAHTVNFENGKEIESVVEKKDIFFDKLFDDYYTLKIPFRNVKAGSIIEAEIVLYSSIYRFPTWNFQTDIPTMHSSFTVIIPEFYSFRKNIRGYIEPKSIVEDVQTVVLDKDLSYISNITTYTFDNVPAMVEEPNVSTVDNYLSRIEYEMSSYRFPGQAETLLSTNWEEISKQLYKHEYLGKQTTVSSSFMSELYDKIKVQQFESDSDIINAAYKIIQSKIRWNNTNSVLCNNIIKEVYKKEEGNSAEINLLLLRLLKDLNYNVFPLALSTRNNGFLSYFPTFYDFNQLIVLVKLNGKNILLDASQRNYPSYILPERDINERGLVIKENGVEWVSLSPQRSDINLKSIEAKIDSKGEMSGKIVMQNKEYGAAKFRGMVNDATDTETFFTNFANQNNILIKTKEIGNLSNQDLPVIVNMTFNNQNSIVNDDELFIQPMFLSNTKANPYKLKTRSYPVEYAQPVEETYVFNLTLPDNYMVSEKPANANIVLPENSGKFSYQISIINNTLQLISKISVKRTLYVPDEYELLKEFYNQIIKKYNEQIVLKKK